MIPLFEVKKLRDGSLTLEDFQIDCVDQVAHALGAHTFEEWLTNWEAPDRTRPLGIDTLIQSYNGEFRTRARDLDKKMETLAKGSGIEDLEASILEEVGEYLDLLAGWMLRLCEIDEEELRTARPVAREIATWLGEEASVLRARRWNDPGGWHQDEWSPLVMKHGADKNVTPIEEWSRVPLRDRLGPDEPRSLVVVLGPGVSQAPAGEPETIEDVTPAFQDADPRDTKFLQKLIAARRENREIARAEWPHGWDLGELDDLRRRLVCSARIATEFLNEPREAEPIVDWNRHAAQLTEQHAKELAAVLVEAAESAEQLPQDDAYRALGLLGAQTLATRLRRLARQIEQKRRILGAEVNWLTDCAWHSLIFRSTLYPQVRELALQVDLCAGRREGPVRRLDLSEAIARKALKEMSPHTARAVLRGFRHSSAGAAAKPGTREAFYRAVAERLWWEHDDEERREFAPPPLAVSMAFDLELERALWATSKGRSFHVLVPALVQLPHGGDTGQVDSETRLRWLLGTYDGDDLPNGELSLLGSLRTPKWTAASETPPGPVVVKLNGSPLHRLPQFAFSTLLLPELDVLDIGVVSLVSNAVARGQGVAPSITQAMPRWFTKSFSQDSTLWLVVGARWSDWNSRSQLFNLLSWPGKYSLRTNRDHVVAVAKRIDHDHISLLRWLHVTLVKGDCIDLTKQLEDAARP